MHTSLQKSIKIGMMLRNAAHIRLLSSPAATGKIQYGPVDPKVKALQQFFTDPNNREDIYIKRGTPDKVLYYITLLLAAAGFANLVKRSYERGLC